MTVEAIKATPTHEALVYTVRFSDGHTLDFTGADLMRLVGHDAHLRLTAKAKLNLRSFIAIN
jgi:hypothetical protein